MQPIAIVAAASPPICFFGDKKFKMGESLLDKISVSLY
jgi:hypothetical protein